jgi:hypothetical protein
MIVAMSIVVVVLAVAAGAVGYQYWSVVRGSGSEEAGRAALDSVHVPAELRLTEERATIASDSGCSVGCPHGWRRTYCARSGEEVDLAAVEGAFDRAGIHLRRFDDDVLEGVDHERDLAVGVIPGDDPARPNCITLYAEGRQG